MSIWRKLWIAWSVFGLGSLGAALVAQEFGADLTGFWIAWSILALGSFAVMEVHGIIRRGKQDTFSELVWSLEEQRSIAVFACLWGIVALTTGNVWPSFPAFALGWCGWHFAVEGPEG